VKCISQSGSKDLTLAVIEQKIVTAEETGMRLDRWFKLHYPGLSFGVLQKPMPALSPARRCVSRLSNLRAMIIGL
jgi:hypothetical protein